MESRTTQNLHKDVRSGTGSWSMSRRGPNANTTSPSRVGRRTQGILLRRADAGVMGNIRRERISGPPSTAVHPFQHRGVRVCAESQAPARPPTILARVSTRRSHHAALNTSSEASILSVNSTRMRATHNGVAMSREHRIGDLFEQRLRNIHRVGRRPILQTPPAWKARIAAIAFARATEPLG